MKKHYWVPCLLLPACLLLAGRAAAQGTGRASSTQGNEASYMGKVAAAAKNQKEKNGDEQARIEKVVLPKLQPLNPEQGKLLQDMLHAQPKVNDLRLNVQTGMAEAFGRLKAAQQSGDPVQVGEAKRAFKEAANHDERLKSVQKPFQDLLRNLEQSGGGQSVPPTPEGRAVGAVQSSGHAFRPLTRGRDDAWRQLQEVDRRLKLLQNADISRDIQPGERLDTKTERFLHDLDKPYDGAGRQDAAAAARLQQVLRLRGRLTDLGHRIDDHNARVADCKGRIDAHERRRPTPPTGPLTAGEADEYNRNVVGPYNAGAAALNAERNALNAEARAQNAERDDLLGQLASVQGD
ncbi:MAG TPA: hypothetical protein VKA46_43470 [Gemmataceae bacterium]|nr:hypothetical protein [Gemmataceae bacterium]